MFYEKAVHHFLITIFDCRNGNLDPFTRGTLVFGVTARILAVLNPTRADGREGDRTDGPFRVDRGYHWLSDAANRPLADQVYQRPQLGGHMPALRKVKAEPRIVRTPLFQNGDELARSNMWRNGVFT